VRRRTLLLLALAGVLVWTTYNFSLYCMGPQGRSRRGSRVSPIGQLSDGT
jgi:hypothetical protein